MFDCLNQHNRFIALKEWFTETKLQDYQFFFLLFKGDKVASSIFFYGNQRSVSLLAIFFFWIAPTIVYVCQAQNKTSLLGNFHLKLNSVS